MKTPPPRSPALEALLAPHRTVLPLAASVAARAVARAAAAADLPDQGARRAFAPPLWVFAAAAGVVIALGAAAYAARAWISAPSPTVPPRGAAVASPRAGGSLPPAAASATPEIAAPAMMTPPAAPPTKRIAGKTAVPPRPTNAELELLRAARRDVTSGDFAGALAIIAEHVRRFRHGSLVEEREALRVKSLAGLGRHEEAQRAAAAFHARFPRSVFLSTFQRMKETDR